MVIKSIQSYNWKGKTVLIVEDDPASIFFLTEILGLTGIKTIAVENGDDALAICKNNKEIDILLMDMNLPTMDGFEATSRIKKINKKIPVIAQTAYALAEDRERCIACGCDDFIAKPINTFELLGKMDALLTKKK